MLSSVYALSSEYSATNTRIDPENRLLWRANIRRLDVESMRDSMLFVSGKLDKTMGGPAVPLHDEKNFRRTLYGAISRAKPDQFLRLFDFPDPNETSERRIATNVPLQQLFFLNSPLMQQQAEMLAQQVKQLRIRPTEDQAGILAALQSASHTARNRKGRRLSFRARKLLAKLPAGVAQRK